MQTIGIILIVIGMLSFLTELWLLPRLLNAEVIEEKKGKPQGEWKYEPPRKYL